MLILTAQNVTHLSGLGTCQKWIKPHAKDDGHGGLPCIGWTLVGSFLERSDGTSDYDVWIGINDGCIWKGSVKGHIRDKGASALLRLIADRMDGK